MNENKTKIVAGIKINYRLTPAGDFASRRTIYKKQPFKGSKYVIYKVPDHIKHPNNEVQTP